jgi:hypothetical protein
MVNRKNQFWSFKDFMSISFNMWTSLVTHPTNGGRGRISSGHLKDAMSNPIGIYVKLKYFS